MRRWATAGAGLEYGNSRGSGNVLASTGKHVWERFPCVLEGIAQGKRIKELAAELGLGTTTIQTYLRRVYEKLQVHSQAEAVAKFLR